MFVQCTEAGVEGRRKQAVVEYFEVLLRRLCERYEDKSREISVRMAVKAEIQTWHSLIK
jgi:hypothetical protein